MTEDEAKKKWCPMARLQNGVGSYNRLLPQGFGCVASACMMWRVDNRLQVESRKKGDPAPEGGGWTLDNPGASFEQFSRITPSGRCGLAGDPK